MVVSLLLWIFLLIRIMTRWCRRFGLVIAFVAVLNSFFLCCWGSWRGCESACLVWFGDCFFSFLCCQGWWECGAGVCRRHYSTAYSGPANNRRYQMLWNAPRTWNHQIWTSPSGFLLSRSRFLLFLAKHTKLNTSKIQNLWNTPGSQMHQIRASPHKGCCLWESSAIINARKKMSLLKIIFLILIET